MMHQDGSSLRVLIVTDGKIGDLVQCRGVALHLTSPELIVERVVETSGWYDLPFRFVGVRPSDRPGKPDSLFDGPASDVVVASGRRTLPYLRLFKRIRSSSQPLLVYLKNPRAGRSASDFIWSPSHDGLSGPDVISTDTAPHGFTADAMRAAAAEGNERFADMPNPRIGMILGGISGSVSWRPEVIEAFCDQIRNLPKKYCFVVTPSRRTPDALLAAVEGALGSHNTWIWYGDGSNPYLQILASCDRLLVTGDSHNMVSECLATGTPTTVYRPLGLQKKLHSFLDRMEQIGATLDLSAGLNHTAFPPLNSTAEIAMAIRGRLAD